MVELQYQYDHSSSWSKLSISVSQPRPRFVKDDWNADRLSCPYLISSLGHTLHQRYQARGRICMFWPI